MAQRIVAILIITLAVAAGAAADVISVRPLVEIKPDAAQITLADVAQLDGDIAKSFAELPVGSIAASQKTITLKLADIRRALQEKDVNWGKVMLRGPMATRVERSIVATVPADEAPPPTANALPPVVKIENAPDAAALPAGPSLRAYLTQWITDQVGSDPAKIQISFDDAQDAVLNQSLAKYRFEIEPIGRNVVGRLTLSLRRYEREQVVGNDRVRAMVKVQRPVVIAKRTLARGQTIVDDDVETKTLWLDSLVKEPLADAGKIIGLQSVGVVNIGEPLYPADVQEPVLVKRGQLVTVRCLAGALVVKTVGRAMDDGQMNQLITVKIERTRDEYQARVSGNQEVVTVTGNPDDVGKKQE
ncbi:MAG: flagellar basal body P-ring formation protein FlgA [Planctomycetes bacterium]|nr:flagellar basal body P-ring formation protein FlgA [Planctomycetota bacterium]